MYVTPIYTVLVSTFRPSFPSCSAGSFLSEWERLVKMIMRATTTRWPHRAMVCVGGFIIVCRVHCGRWNDPNQTLHVRHCTTMWAEQRTRIASGTTVLSCMVGFLYNNFVLKACSPVPGYRHGGLVVKASAP